MHLHYQSLELAWMLHVLRGFAEIVLRMLFDLADEIIKCTITNYLMMTINVGAMNMKNQHEIRSCNLYTWVGGCLHEDQDARIDVVSILNT